MLSDACHAFLSTSGSSIRELLNSVEHYASADWEYGPELEALRLACQPVVADPDDNAARRWLNCLAHTVMQYHDNAPNDAEDETLQLLVTCGATLGDIIEEHQSATSERPEIEKLWPGDARGEYGDYLLWVDASQAATILRRYPKVVRQS